MLSVGYHESAASSAEFELPRGTLRACSAGRTYDIIKLQALERRLFELQNKIQVLLWQDALQIDAPPAGPGGSRLRWQLMLAGEDEPVPAEIDSRQFRGRVQVAHCASPAMEMILDGTD
jgi:hypothetical protein